MKNHGSKQNKMLTNKILKKLFVLGLSLFPTLALAAPIETTVISFQYDAMGNRISQLNSNPDSDGDGILDSWELTHFGTLNHDMSLDSDNDGISDLDEYHAGTNPNPIPSIIGTDLDDFLDGTTAADRLLGLEGNDQLIAGDGDDILVGGQGNDSLDGGMGNDTYQLTLGDGQDEIIDNDGINIIEFDASITPDMVQVSLGEVNTYPALILTINSSGDTITLLNWEGDTTAILDRIAFDDGTIWMNADIQTMLQGGGGDPDPSSDIVGTELDDLLDGTTAADRLLGLEGNDQLIANGGDDILVGGQGFDKLDGGMGNDTYQFTLGDGQDLIMDNDGLNVIEFDATITADMVALSVGEVNTYPALILTINSSGDTITLLNWEGDTTAILDRIVFYDGTIWMNADIQTMLQGGGGDPDPSSDIVGTELDDLLDGTTAADRLLGLEGNDQLIADGGDDILVGGQGNDTLDGGMGNDTYQFTLGDGQDLIMDNDGLNVIEFDATITADMVALSGGEVNTYPALILTINSSGDTITLLNWEGDTTAILDRIVFYDGTIWTNANIQAMLQGGDPNDVDNDGILDTWEIEHFGDLNHDMLLDSDGDSLTDGEEFTAGTNPGSFDTDGDGMPDGWEISQNLNPLIDDAAGDIDGDGQSNLTEYNLSNGVSETSYGYYFLNNNWVGESITVLGLLDGTSVTIAGSSYVLNTGEVITHTITTQGEVIKADKAFTVASEADGIDLPAPFSFLGTQFVIPNLRYNHTYFLLSPEFDAQVHIDIGTTGHDINLVAGQVYEFNAGSDEKVTGRIRSNQGIVVTHSGDVTDDVYPVPPATKSLWGIRSNYAYVSALEDNTQVTVYSSSGTSTSFVLGAAEVKEITIGSSTTQGQGDAIHLVADKPIAAVQHADSDGTETTGFWSSSYFSSDYTLPVDSQYVSIVCNTADTVITLYDAEGLMTNSKSCNSDGTYPGKTYFGSSTNGINIEAGSRVEASEPVYLIHEVSASDDERNLLGFEVPSPLIAIQYMGSSIGETALNTIEFIVTASPTPENEEKVQTVEFSLDGDNWFNAQDIDNVGVFQVNFGYLTAGNYTLFSKVNTVDEQQVDLIVENESPITEFGNGYYFLNNNWVGESITVLGLLDDTSVTIAESSYALNAGEIITHTITTQGEIIKADKAFTVASEADGIDLPAPFSFLGTQFVIPNLRYNHTYFLLSPEFDAQVHIDIGTTGHDINLIAGQVYEFNAGSDEKVTGRIRSNQGIVVTHSGDVTDDVYPVPPATKSLWGVRSNYAYVSALEDNTLVTVYESSGTSTSFILGAAEVKEITIGLSTTQGQGGALHLVADKPIAAVQHADSDGTETTGFWSSSYFSSDFTLPVDSQYVSIVCNTADTVITLYDAEGLMTNSKSCNSDGTYPGKAYFGSSTNGINIEAGSRVEASEPVYLIHEVSASDDERNLMGITMPLI